MFQTSAFSNLRHFYLRFYIKRRIFEDAMLTLFDSLPTLLLLADAKADFVCNSSLSKTIRKFWDLTEVIL